MAILLVNVSNEISLPNLYHSRNERIFQCFTTLCRDLLKKKWAHLLFMPLV